jgi:hypothetical protein
MNECPLKGSSMVIASNQLASKTPNMQRSSHCLHRNLCHQKPSNQHVAEIMMVAAGLYLMVDPPFLVESDLVVNWQSCATLSCIPLHIIPTLD